MRTSVSVRTSVLVCCISALAWAAGCSSNDDATGDAQNAGAALEQSPGGQCSVSDHCAFFGELGQCQGISACKAVVTGGGCQGSAVASADHDRFCRGAASQADPKQACQIFGPAFDCVWTDGVTACLPR
jgi:hypothetical protein